MVEMRFDDEKNNLKLPKNIRQVGKPSEKIKIYVEDYVITYINQIARDSSDRQRLAVLLGRLGKNGDTSVAFIDGAVEARDVVVQEDQVVFTSEIWTEIYDEIGQYFHNTEVVGWFLTRPGKSLGINEKITKIHVDNFPGVDKALFIIDPLDHDEAFYIYNQGDLVRQEGYYIYYERNEDMQNYMVDHRGGESSEQAAGNVFLKKREELLERKQTLKGKDSGFKSLFFKAAEEKSAGAKNTLKAAESASAPETKDSESPGKSAADTGKTSIFRATGKRQAAGSSDTAADKGSGDTSGVAGKGKFGKAGDVMDKKGKAVSDTTASGSGKGAKAGSLSADVLQGLKRASSLVVTFAILFALIFGFTQLNQKQAASQQTGSNSAGGVVPVDEVAGNVKTEDEKNAAANGGAGTSVADNGSGKDAAGTAGSGSDGQNVAGNTDNGSNVADNGSVGTNVADGSDGTNVADNGSDGSNGTNVADNGSDGTNVADNGSKGTNVADNGNDGKVADNGSDGTNVAGNPTDGTKTADNSDSTADGSGGTATADNSGASANNSDGSDGVPVQNVIRQYEVKDGDTLAGISQKFYSSYKYIELIQEMNQIEDADKIYPGMKLNLP